MGSKTFTTQEAAEAVGITRATLQEWIKKGKLSVPRLQIRGSHVVRLWTLKDVANLRQAKKRLYRKEMGRPRKKGKR